MSEDLFQLQGEVAAVIGGTGVLGGAMADALAAAKNPVIVSEYGGRDGATSDALVGLAEALAIPVFDGEASVCANFPKNRSLYQGTDMSAVKDDADLVLVTVSSNAGRQNPQFYRSTDGGRRWQLIEAVGSQDDMVVAIDWDPIIENQVYAGTDGGKIYRSNDGGQQWEPVPVQLPKIAIGAMVVAQTST